MMTNTVLALVGLIVFVLALAIVFPIIYKEFTGKRAIDACREVMSLFDVEWNVMVTKIRFNIFTPLCYTFLPF